MVFTPKYLRKMIYKTLREDVIAIIKKLCKEMRVEIIEQEACPDHISPGEYPSVHENSTVCGEAQEQKRPDDLG